MNASFGQAQFCQIGGIARQVLLAVVHDNVNRFKRIDFFNIGAKAKLKGDLATRTSVGAAGPNFTLWLCHRDFPNSCT